MGLLHHTLNFCDAFVPKHKKLKPLQTVVIKVKMDCEGCERRVKNSVIHLKGVTSVDVDRKQSKVSVTGHVEPTRVLKKVRSTGKKAEFWPYISYKMATYPYVAQAYDKKAPPGYVRSAPQAYATPDAPEEKYVHLFSDENPNAPCAIM
ncbi:Heavy metal-associated isoprenylated plant protein 21 [Bienertia sinuspersici]